MKCANILCQAKGFPSGLFIEASNNFCEDSFTSEAVYVYILDKDIIQEENRDAEARITAGCFSMGTIVYLSCF